MTGDYAVVFRRGSVGSRVRVKVARRRGERVEASVVEVLEPGPHAVAPRCRHFGTCGGCSFQDVAYPSQLAFKRAMVQEALAACDLDECACRFQMKAEGARVRDSRARAGSPRPAAPTRNWPASSPIDAPSA